MTRDGGSESARRRPRSPAALLFAALPFAILLAVPPRALAQNGDIEVERTVSKVEIHGNHAFGSGTLKNLLRTHGRGGFPFFRRRPLRSDYIRFDRLTLQDYYRRHGFIQANVDSVPLRFDAKGEEAEVHFYLTEGPRARVDSVRFEGAGPVPEDRLRRLIELKPGDPLDIAKQDLSREAVHDEYAERGYVAAVVRDSLEVESTSVHVVYRIAPGPEARLDSVRVEGTAVTRPSFVAREFAVHRGEVLKRSKLLRSQQRIYDTGFYSDVRFDRTDVDSAGAADVIVDVRERKMGWIDAGIGYGTVDQLRLTGQLGQRNLARDGIQLVANGLLGVRIQQATEGSVHFPYFKFHPHELRLGDSRFDASLTRPWNLGLRVAATIGGYAEHVRPVTGTQVFGPYRAYGGSFALSHDFTLHTRTRFSFEHRNVVSDTTNQFAANPESYTINRVVASLERDTRDNPFDPRTGTDFVQTSSFVGGALSGTARYLKNVATGTLFLPINPATTGAFRVRVGVINPQAARLLPAGTPPDLILLIPPEERFFLGGANTIRGYGENELGSRAQVDSTGRYLEISDTTGAEHRLPILRVGGRILLLVNAELRHELFGPFGMEVFLDGGNVWERPVDIHLRNLLSFGGRAGYNDMRYTAGLGLRFATPLGPLRLDYGWKIRMARPDQPDPATSRGEFHFSVGQAF
ncbi:MAG: outer membrane protein assembly factor [Bacteroidota bacterium]